MTFWKTLISVQILLVIVTGCQTTNSNKSTSNNNINVSEIKNSLHEDGLGILKFNEPSPLISKNAKAPISVLKGPDTDSSVIKFQLKHGDCGEEPNWSDCDNDRERSELTFEKEIAKKEKWYKFKLYFTTTHKQAHPSPLSIIQWKRFSKPSRTLVMFLHLQSGLWFNQNGDTFYNSHKALVKEKDLYNRWIEVIFNTNWHPDRGKGFMRVWINGEKKVDFEGVSHSPNGEKLSLRFGLYSSWLKRFRKLFPDEKHPTREVYFDAVKGSTNCEGPLSRSRCILLKN